MNKEALMGQRGYFSMVHGVTLRAIGVFSDADLDFRPQPGMRSVRELIQHLYGAEKALTQGALRGQITLEEENLGIPESVEAQPILAGLRTIADVQAYADECHRAADEALQAISDEQLQLEVESPFGTFPAWQYFTFVYDEHWHHRGQLYTYARLLGKQPPMLYDYQ